MQIELTTAISILSGMVSAAFALYLGIARYAIGQREREIDRRIEELSKLHLQLMDEVKKLAERLAVEEKTTIRLDGSIQLVKQTHDDVLGDVEEIKRLIVTKAEWEPRMNNLERTLNQVLGELRGSRYSHVSIPTPLPPKKLGP